jgi:hypothetical protein
MKTMNLAALTKFHSFLTGIKNAALTPQNVSVDPEWLKEANQV